MHCREKSLSYSTVPLPSCPGLVSPYGVFVLRFDVPSLFFFLLIFSFSFTLVAFPLLYVQFCEAETIWFCSSSDFQEVSAPELHIPAPAKSFGSGSATLFMFSFLIFSRDHWHCQCPVYKGALIHRMVQNLISRIRVFLFIRTILSAFSFQVPEMVNKHKKNGDKIQHQYYTVDIDFYADVKTVEKSTCSENTPKKLTKRLRKGPLTSLFYKVCG